MNTVKDIVSYLEAEVEEAYNKHKYWKTIDSSEAGKYLTKAYTLEHVLEEIEPPEEQAAEEDIAQVLVSDPREKKPKKSFLEFYLNVFFISSLFASAISIWLILSLFLDRIGITGTMQSILLLVYECLHLTSFLLMLKHSHLLLTNERKGER